MAKKKHSAGKLVALAAITGAVAGCVSYFLRYKSFHKELEEDFHDFEGDDDFDGQLPHENECCCKTKTVSEKVCEAGKNALDTAKTMAEDMKEATAEKTAEVLENLSDKTEEAAEMLEEKAEEISETVSDKIEDAAEEAADMAQEAAKELKEKATTIVEEDKEA